MIDIDEWLSRMVEEESTTTESNVKGNAKRESMFGCDLPIRLCQFY